MMKKFFGAVLPSPLLSAALLALWLVLNASASPGHVLFGALLAVAVPLLTASLRPTPVRIRKPLVIAKLILTVGWDVLVWNYRVATGILASRKHAPNGAFVIIPLDLRDPNGLAALAIIMCVIPGTVWSELSLDRSKLLVHVFDLKDEPLEVQHLKTRYEKPLMEIFE
ncbi:Na+/H+ antiporter subunit E [Variovorax sp. VNK109]|uniref:Na+/H+ antiporter subunit E n=1 Tax=Variovorax sp. VNK109 TaxID=3400919 RepID=UPI003C0A937F